MLLSGPRVAAAVAVAAFLVAALRVADTWRLFTETTDEAFHIACGIEWLDAGTYTFETHHPPLARIAVALGPYLSGTRFHHQQDAPREGRMILDTAPDYYGLLASARAGNLLFLALGCLGVWLLGKECGGASVAAAATVAFTLVPMILGHAGLATTDMALASCLVLAFWAWKRALDSPDPGAAALAGFCTALAVGAKLSAIAFLPATLLPLVIGRFRRTGGTGKRQWLRASGLAAGAFLVTLAALYRFAALPVRTPPGRRFLLLDHWIGNTGWWHDAVYRLLEIPLPLTPVIKGMGEVFQHNWDGHSAYLFGHSSQHGWWYFFPVALSVKTPLAFLACTGAGAMWAVRERNRPALACLWAASAVVLASMPSNLNIGVRHVLPFFAFLSPVVGLATMRLWRRSKPATLLLAGCLVSPGITAHPHYMADFNLLAGDRPERILADSDLDWGQDLRFATEAMRRRGVREAWIAYEGLARIDRQQGITWHALPARTPLTGWVAASVKQTYFEGARSVAFGKPEPYAWLKQLTPVERAGRSILIYHVGGAGR